MEYGLSLGSNIEDRQANIQSAIDMIGDIEGLLIVDKSALYETAPVDVLQEYEHLSFLNTVVIVESDLLPAKLHTELQGIENRLGRVRGKDQNAPRPIDIDLIYADGVTLNTATLILPHPRWAERRFVVQPLAEVRAGLVIDKALGPVNNVLLSLPEEPEVIMFKGDKGLKLLKKDVESDL